MSSQPYKTCRKPGQSIPEAVEELLAQMTLEEKLGQMSQSVGADITAVGSTRVHEPVEELIRKGRLGSMIQVGEPGELAGRVRRFQTLAVQESRLGIPLLFCQDVIHGFETVFPIPLAWSCSFDEQRIRAAAHTAAQEAACCGIMCAYSPMVDIPHDPRWGRAAETAGEDPWWGAQVAKALVEGLQDPADGGGLLACLKHYLGYAAAEAGRDYNTTEFSETALRNLYLPPFKAGIEAGAGSVMTGFNVVNGVPAVANRPLVKDLLRGELGFEGLVISDYAAVMELLEHGVAEDEAEAAAKALAATLDIEMTTNYFRRCLPRLIAEDTAKARMVDDAVRRILTAKYKLGIMDDPYRFLREKEIPTRVFAPQARAQSRELAVRSAVLLKNNGVLPLQKGGTAAVIGPFADSTDLCGCWSFSTRRQETVTLAQGLRAKGLRLLTEPGSGVEEALPGGIERARQAARRADVVVLALGESSVMSGEACSRMNIEVPPCQTELARAVLEEKKPTVLVLLNGRPLLLDWYDEHMDAILEGWALGSEAGAALADLLVGDEVPSGKLTMTFPRHTGQIPLYYNALPTGRPYVEGSGEHFQSKYLDGPNRPLYPFGHGLGYAECRCGELCLSAHELPAQGSITASLELTNLGSLPARETVQLYLRDCCASISRPVMELKGIQKAELAPKESRRVEFVITEPMLRFYDAQGRFASEPGRFEVMAGLSSDERTLKKQTFRLV